MMLLGRAAMPGCPGYAPVARTWASVMVALASALAAASDLRRGSRPVDRRTLLGAGLAALLGRACAPAIARASVRPRMEAVATRLGPLEARVVQPDPSARPELAVVLCHGFGAPGTDLVPLAGELLERRPSLASGVRFVFPAAPLVLPGFGWGEARAWFPIDLEAQIALRASGEAARARLRGQVPEGLAQARRQLAACLEAVAQTSGLSPGRIVLGGFSQGAMVGTDLALRADQAPAALVILSGILLAEGEWRARAPRRKGLRVLQSHGRSDPILPFSDAEALRDLLVQAGLEVEFIPFDGPHTIAWQALDRLGALLESLLEG